MRIDRLGMPLCPIVGEMDMLDRLDLAVISTPSRYDESIPECVDRLMMDRVDPYIIAKYSIYESSTHDTRCIYIFVSTMSLIVYIAPHYILYEISTMSDIEELHPFADAEYRLASIHDSSHDRDES